MVFCTYCGHPFTREEHLERHILTHSNVKPFKCFRCHMSFGRRDLLQRHYAVHGRDKDNQEVMPQSTGIIKSAGRTPIACNNCAKSKTKCDKKFPCTRCESRKLTCTVRPTRRVSKQVHRVGAAPAAAAADAAADKLSEDSAEGSSVASVKSSPEVGHLQSGPLQQPLEISTPEQEQLLQEQQTYRHHTPSSESCHSTPSRPSSSSPTLRSATGICLDTDCKHVPSSIMTMPAIPDSTDFIDPTATIISGHESPPKSIIPGLGPGTEPNFFHHPQFSMSWPYVSGMGGFDMGPMLSGTCKGPYYTPVTAASENMFATTMPSFQHSQMPVSPPLMPMAHAGDPFSGLGELSSSSASILYPTPQPSVVTSPANTLTDMEAALAGQDTYFTSNVPTWLCAFTTEVKTET